jgi:hypothetical protein
MQIIKKLSYELSNNNIKIDQLIALGMTKVPSGNGEYSYFLGKDKFKTLL